MTYFYDTDGNRWLPISMQRDYVGGLGYVTTMCMMMPVEIPIASGEVVTCFDPAPIRGEVYAALEKEGFLREIDTDDYAVVPTIGTAGGKALRAELGYDAAEEIASAVLEREVKHFRCLTHRERERVRRHVGTHYVTTVEAV